LIFKNEIHEFDEYRSFSQNQLKIKDAEIARLQVEMEREIAKQKFEIARLSTLLKEYDDYEEIKRELEIFKTLEIGESLQGHNDESGENIPLERLLLEKNKKLENLNTTLKVSRFPYYANF
jgi:homeobox protein cut-like